MANGDPTMFGQVLGYHYGQPVYDPAKWQQHQMRGIEIATQQAMLYNMGAQKTVPVDICKPFPRTEEQKSRVFNRRYDRMVDQSKERIVRRYRQAAIVIGTAWGVILVVVLTAGLFKLAIKAVLG